MTSTEMHVQQTNKCFIVNQDAHNNRVYDAQRQGPGAFGTITPSIYSVSKTIDVTMDLDEPSIDPTAPRHHIMK
jgi:hypothetical protein